jgi:hypothetical protein
MHYTSFGAVATNGEEGRKEGMNETGEIRKYFILRFFNSMLSGCFVTTEWPILRLRMEETASRYGG